MEHAKKDTVTAVLQASSEPVVETGKGNIKEKPLYGNFYITTLPSVD